MGGEPITPDCRVTGVETRLVGTRWRNWVFAEVHTDDGIKGIGEDTCEWQAKAVEAAIHQLAERDLVGQPAFATERLWRAMFRNESPGASICWSMRRGRRAGTTRSRCCRASGVGAFQVEVAKAHPLDPRAFLPVWSDDWRRRF